VNLVAKLGLVAVSFTPTLRVSRTSTLLTEMASDPQTANEDADLISFIGCRRQAKRLRDPNYGWDQRDHHAGGPKRKRGKIDFTPYDPDNWKT
jgi:hypothetical protein